MATRRVLGVLAAAAAAGAVLAVTAAASDARTGAGPALDAREVQRAVRIGARATRVPTRLTPRLAEVAQDDEQIHDQDCAAAERAGDATFGQCVYGRGRRLAILFGDSHAGMWFAGVRAAAITAGWRLRIFYRSDCPAPAMVFWTHDRTGRNRSCERWRRRAIRTIKRLRPGLVIVTSSTYKQPVSRTRNATARQWRLALTRTLRALSAPRRRVVLLGDIPLERVPMPDCIARNRFRLQRCMTPRQDALQDVLIDAEQRAARGARARYVDVRPWFCASLCPPVVARVVVFRDTFNITGSYSFFLRGALAQALQLAQR